MKLRTLTLAALSLFAVTAKAQTLPTIIYDTIGFGWPPTGNITSNTDTPRFRMGDGFSTLQAPALTRWRVRWVDVRQVFVAAGTYNNVTARLQFFNDWNHVSTATPVFGDLVSDTTWSLGNRTTHGFTAITHRFDFRAANREFYFSDGQSVGFAITWLVNGVGNNNLTTGITDGPVHVGTSTNLFYQDGRHPFGNLNGIIEGNEASWLFPASNNLMVRVHADAAPVPEPATALLALGACAAAIARRRRKK